MSNHLSEDQFARCAAGRPAREDLQHIRACAECGAELERFANKLSLFRSAIRHRIDDRVVLYPTGVTSLRPAHPRIPKWSWALVGTAFLVLVMFPFFVSEIRPPDAGERTSSEANPDAVMDRVNRHLSRIVPAPMEPVMLLIPSEEFVSNPGGVQ